MKKSPDTKRLEEILRSSALSATGFLGTDTRSLSEIIDSDLAVLSELGYTTQQLAQRMSEITETAKKALGNWAKINDELTACVFEAKGKIPCPWPQHSEYFFKRVTLVRNIKTNRDIKWSDLSIHFIGEHNFFEGRGSTFRIEPKDLIELIF